MIYKKPLTCGLFRAAKPLAKTFSWILLLAVFSFSAAGQTSADNPKKSGAHAGFFADGGERLLHPSDPDFYTIILDRTGVAAAGLGAASTMGYLFWLGWETVSSPGDAALNLAASVIAGVYVSGVPALTAAIGLTAAGMGIDGCRKAFGRIKKSGQQPGAGITGA